MKITIILYKGKFLSNHYVIPEIHILQFHLITFRTQSGISTDTFFLLFSLFLHHLSTRSC